MSMFPEELMLSQGLPQNILSAVGAAPGVNLEDVDCPMGCPRADDPLFLGWDRLHHLSGRFPVVRCRTCLLVRTNPRPNLDTIGSYYPDIYGPYRESCPLAAKDHALALSVGRWARWKRWARLDGTRDLLPTGLRPGKGLEIGSATGDFMAKLRDHGWQMQGIEPSAGAAERARKRGFQVHVGQIETAPEISDNFDLVVASHTLEHLHQPLRSLERLRGWVQPGALLTCSVPDAGSYLFRAFGNAWYDLDVPRHLLHFDRHTLSAMLVRTGWQPFRIRSQRTSNSLIGSLGVLLGDRPGALARRLGAVCAQFPESKSLFKKALSPALETVLAVTNQTGRMVVWAKAV